MSFRIKPAWRDFGGWDFCISIFKAHENVQVNGQEHEKNTASRGFMRVGVLVTSAVCLCCSDGFSTSVQACLLSMHVHTSVLSSVSSLLWFLLRARRSGRPWQPKKCPPWWTTSSQPSSTLLRHQRVREGISAHRLASFCLSLWYL